MKEENNAEAQEPSFIYKDKEGNEVTHIIDELSNENQARVGHIRSLRNKIQIEVFEYAEKISCLKAGLMAYEQELVQSLTPEKDLEQEKAES